MLTLSQHYVTMNMKSKIEEGDKVKKSYYAVIPANVRYDNELTPNAKLLYGEITALANEKGYCWASNSYFSKLYEVSKETVSRWITNLENKGYIYTQLIYKEGSKEIKERRIYITPIDKNINTYCQNNQYPIDKNVNTPIDKNVKENNTVFNNTINNKEIYKYIVEYLNEKANKNFKHTNKATQRLINARLNEGFSLDDFKKVIDIKSSQWLSTDMEKYLRPQTLFGTKFESYLNENKGGGVNNGKSRGNNGQNADLYAGIGFTAEDLQELWGN